MKQPKKVVVSLIGGGIHGCRRMNLNRRHVGSPYTRTWHNLVMKMSSIHNIIMQVVETGYLLYTDLKQNAKCPTSAMAA